jgi:hypothetical protein
MRNMDLNRLIVQVVKAQALADASCPTLQARVRPFSEKKGLRGKRTESLRIFRPRALDLPLSLSRI